MPPIVRRATDADRPAWDEFIASRPEADLLQAWGWGECTALAGEPPIRILAEDGGRVRGVAQVLMRSAGFGRQVAYAPHGPVWERSAPDADRVFAWLVHGLRSLARKERALVVKLDPRAEPGEAWDFAPLAREHGLRRAPDLQAPTTRIVDLPWRGEELADDEAALAGLDRDTRYAVRRGRREGTEVTISRDADPTAVEVLHDLLRATAERAGFRVRSREFLARLANEFAASGAWYLGIARVRGTPIATMAFPRVGDRAYYLYGAMLRDPAFKHNYGSHAVMVAMQKALAVDGCRSVDMWGVVEPDDPDADPAWKGFSDFKRAFGGTPLRHPGLYDLVIDPFWYRLRELRSRLRPGD